MLPLNAVEIFETFHRVAARICTDEDVANDIATEEFEKYISMKAPSVVRSLRAYAWKIVGAKWRQHLKTQWSFVSEGRFDDEDAFHNLLPPTAANQEDYVEARYWIPKINALPEPSRTAIAILAGGGSAADVISEMNLTPKSALLAINEARRLLRLSLQNDEIGLDIAA